MKRLAGYLSILITLIFIGLDYSAQASHVSGGSIKYTYLGPGSTAGTYRYKIRVGYVRDCNGIRYSSTFENVTAMCMPGGTNQRVFRANKVNYIPKPGERPANQGAKDVSDVCRSKPSSCAGRNNPNGYEINYYEVDVTLPQCNYWQIYVQQGQCCRNGTVNSTGSYFSPMTQLNNLQFPTNSSPNFADEVKPMPSVCTGQNVFYGIGTVDPDGDSLRFYLRAGRDRQTGTNVTNVNYRAGYSATSPIPGIVLDSATGLISFRSNTTGKFLVSFFVEEYERCTGRLKGRTHREVQFIVANCTNRVPRDISGISNLVGNAKKLGKFSLEVCEGTQITWDDTVVDQDRNDTLYFSSNVDSVLPGVSWSVQHLARNQAVVRFTWRAQLSLGQYATFFLSFDDDRCDFPGNGFSVFDIYVRPAASAGPDQTICKGDTAFLDALGGTSFEWHVISGDPLITGVNWFPDTTLKDTNRTAAFIPTRTTSLWVEVDTLKDACGGFTIANCFTTDTINIFVPDSFGITTVPDFFLCNPGSGQLDVSASQPFTYTYKWEPSNLVSNRNIKNPTFSNVKYPTTFGVTVTSDSGCVREGEVNVNVTDPFPTNMQIKATDTLICLQKNINLWVDRGIVDYGKLCDTSTYSCQGNYANFDLGSGNTTNTNQGTNMPITYGSWFFSAKAQYLYTAAELRARGMRAGPINSISWFIQSLYSGLSTPFNSFTIRMRCTSLTDLPTNSFAPQGTVVYGPKAFLPAAGWNDHVLDRDYNWDGNSNLIVEVCWENGTNRYPAHHIQQFDNKSYRASSLYFQTNTFSQGPGCAAGAPSGGYPSTALPRTRFNACTGTRSSLIKYSWAAQGNGGFVGATNKDSVAANVNLGTAKKYFVYLEDSMFGVCKDTLEIDINVVSSYNTKPNNLGEQCVTGGFIQLTSPTPWNLNGIKPGGKWSGIGVVNDTLGIWDPNQSGPGKHWVKYSFQGDACASEDSIQIEIVGLPDVSILAPDSICELFTGPSLTDTSRHLLVGRVPGGTFTGKGVDSLRVSTNPDKYKYWLDGTQFNPLPGKPDTAYIRHKLFRGCWHDTILKIPVVASWDSTFLGIMYNGIPFEDFTFCKTSGVDTLMVAGPRARWKSINNPQAMIDTFRGVYNPRLAAAGPDTIVVYNDEFCGTENRITVFVNDTIEIEVQPNAYCFANGCIGIPFLERDDSVYVKIPKGPGIGGTGTRRLGVDGNDIILFRALSTNSGWTSVVDNEDFNKWSGDLNTPPQVAKFRPCELKEGSYKFEYQFPIRYRQNHPRNLCYSRDFASIVVAKPPVVPVSSGENYAYCPKDEIKGIQIDITNSGYRPNYAIEWYVDTNFSPVYVGNPLDTTGLDNNIGGHRLFVRYVNNEAGCSGPFLGVPYKVYQNPQVTFSVDKEKIFVGDDLVSFTNTTDYSDTGMFYQWFDLKESDFKATTGDNVDQDLSMRDAGDFNLSPWYHRLRYGANASEDYEKPCEPRDGLTRKINVSLVQDTVNGRMVPVSTETTTETDTLCNWRRRYQSFGGYGMWLVGINEVGCADTMFYGLTVDQRVEPKFPNVFTPDGDGINDFWSIIPPVGDECPCPPAAGSDKNNCYCEEGEALLRDLYRRDFLSLEGYIYDRWGRKVFELSLDEPIWKGQNMAGNDQVDGVYFFTLKGTMRTQDEAPLVDPSTGESPQGSITLIRGN